MVLMNLSEEQQWRQRTDVWTRLAGEEGEGGMYGEGNMETYITLCKIKPTETNHHLMKV